MRTSNEIRQQFIDFFVSKEHHQVPSAPVIPFDDPTLLFTNAGMNQFKNIFLGVTKPEFPRAVDTQKCIRAGGKHNDLEEVGKDSYHHTFFEMLGNWSFADYYKKEAISWAWELFTKVWGLPKDILYATVHHSDQEAFEFWKNETDIDPSHIEYHGDKDNFWEMGLTGPCGPCSEIHIDRGEEFCNMKDVPGHVCKVNGDCHRIIELWNLVFIQFNRDEEGELHPLESQYVDTGAGFERVCMILQGKKSNYDTDLFAPIIQAIAEMTGVAYNEGEEGTSHRVIADHIRALSFAIADGGLPSNEGRGYVLRRILRRAARHGRLLNQHQPFLYKLVDVVCDVMGHHFRELNEKKAHIKMIVQAEEERFNTTLDKGLTKFEEIVSAMDGTTIPGADAFMLYDTFGFPFDLTRILAEERSLSVDENGFNEELEKQRTRAREAGKFVMNMENIEWTAYRDDEPTEFIGYLRDTTHCHIIKYTLDDDNNVRIILDRTPFYAESGGQVADMGRIFNEEIEIQISDVKKQGKQFIHFGKLVKGIIQDREFTASIEKEYRKNVARNHTATHLLHAALRKVLGEHVQQKGSLVHPYYLRFDFTHFKAMSPREASLVERMVNDKVRECFPVSTRTMDLDTARNEGAMALFGEKYEDEVRVVSIDSFSKELCGGTHLDYTGEIGLFKITTETSSAAGVRRIEAITGTQAEDHVRRLESEKEEIQNLLNVPSGKSIQKIQSLLDELKAMHQENESLRLKASGDVIADMVGGAINIKGIKVACGKVEADDSNQLRNIGDQLRGKIHSGIGVLMADIEGKVSLIVIVTNDLTKRAHAGKIAGRIATLVGGKGGGRPDMAMAGGKDVDAIESALKEVPQIIEEMVN